MLSESIFSNTMPRLSRTLTFLRPTTTRLLVAVTIALFACTSEARHLGSRVIPARVLSDPAHYALLEDASGELQATHGFPGVEFAGDLSDFGRTFHAPDNAFKVNKRRLGLRMPNIIYLREPGDKRYPSRLFAQPTA
ncbi:hypothetical protein AAVH_23245 [Aphelenchoides avenae]|nr:hypothetical protein AAVH_23245 [Aphelenchus avenae]